MTIVIGIVVFVTLVLVLLKLKSYLDIINKELSPDEEKYEYDNSTKKALIIYTPSKHDSATIIKDNIVKKLTSKGFGVKVNFPSTELNYNYDEFQVICYISPVYMKKVSKPMLEMMRESKYKDKKVIIISVGTSEENKEELKLMKEYIEKKNEFHLAKLRKEETKKLNNFIEGVLID